jgi:hypothetical protein
VEREIKTMLLPWLGKATEEAEEVRALRREIGEAVKKGTISHEAKKRVLTANAKESNDAKARRNRLYHLGLMFAEDLASEKIRQARAQGTSKEKAAEADVDRETESMFQ